MSGCIARERRGEKSSLTTSGCVRHYKQDGIRSRQLQRKIEDCKQSINSKSKFQIGPQCVRVAAMGFYLAGSNLHDHSHSELCLLKLSLSNINPPLHDRLQRIIQLNSFVFILGLLKRKNSNGQDNSCGASPESSDSDYSGNPSSASKRLHAESPLTVPTVTPPPSDILSRAFPGSSHAVLEHVLKGCNGNVLQAIEVIV